MSRIRVTMGLMLAALVLGGAAQASDVVFVDDDAVPGGDGTSWASALDDLQAALGLAGPGGACEIRVAQGTYRPADGPGSRSANFEMPSGVAIRGGYAGPGAPDPDLRDPDLFVTILSGDLAGDDGTEGSNDENCFHVVTAWFVDATAVLDGVHVTGGNANGGGLNGRGAGLASVFAGPTVIDVAFVGNEATGGGGAYVLGGDGIVFTTCRFTGNVAHAELSDEGGGGLVVEGSATVLLEGCTVDANTSVRDGGGVLALAGSVVSLQGGSVTGNVAGNRGGGFRLDDADLDVDGTAITANEADNDGGGISADGDLTLRLTAADVSGNDADAGGGVFLRDGTFIAAGCTFRNNDGQGVLVLAGMWADVQGCVFGENFGGGTTTDGGGLNLAATPGSVRECSFLDNFAGDHGGAIGAYGNTSLEITDCTFELNDNYAIWLGAGSDVAATTVITDCTFMANEGAVSVTGGAFAPPTTVDLIGCTISSTTNVAAITATDADSVARLTDCVLDGCGRGGITIGAATLEMHGCTVRNVTGGHGARLSSTATGLLTDCLFTGQIPGAGAPGGGVELEFDSVGVFERCAFIDNRTSGDGGGIAVTSDSTLTLRSSIVAGNVSASTSFPFDGGGGIKVDDGATATIEGCTIFANEATGGPGGGIHANDADVTVRNSILWRNTDPAGGGLQGQFATSDDGVVTLDYCDIAGSAGMVLGFGNIDATPQFVDDTGPDGIRGTEDDDLHLADGSPCINAGDPLVPPVAVLDIDGEARVVFCQADLGADEAANAPVDDCNGNGEPDACDVQQGLADDCDANGVPDECDVARLDCNGNGVPDACDAARLDCNANGVPDDCDVAGGFSLDCNGNGLPDSCEVMVDVDEDSGELTPFGFPFPQTFVIPGALPALADVELDFSAIGDLGKSLEFYEVFVNGGFIAQIGGNNTCSIVSEADVTVPAATWNALVGNGDAVLEMVPSPAVKTLCEKGFVQVRVVYVGGTDADLDRSGVPDDCECLSDVDGSGAVGFADLLAVLTAWGACPPACPEDVDFDGVVGFGDVLRVLSDWGGC